MKKRADGLYKTAVYLGRDEDGRKQYKYVYAKSKVELKEKETAVRAELGKGVDLLAARDSFATWADGFLAIKAASKISDKQKGNYKHSVALWKGFLQGYEIGQVRPDDIERVLLALQGQGYAERTVQFHLGTIRQIMRRATGRVIASNPVDQVELTTTGTPEQKRRALTAEEQRWIWETPGRGQVVAVIMMLSGLRRGELAALTWNDIDLEAQAIHVNKSIEYLNDSTYRLKPFPKTEAGLRTVDIPKRLCDYLRTLPRDNVLVVHTKRGGVMTASAWVKLWSSYMRQLNIKYGTGLQKPRRPGQPGPPVYEMTIPPITLHWLRHTFCTLMYFAGVDVVQACAQMGHADVKTTLAIYTHLDAIHKRKSVDKLDGYLDEVGKRWVN